MLSIALSAIFISIAQFPACASTEDYVGATETVDLVYNAPEKWQLEPEKDIYFSVSGLINPRYFSTRPDNSAEPLKEYYENCDWDKIAAAHAEKSMVKQGMPALMLTATSSEKIALDNFYFENSTNELCFRFPEPGNDNDQPPLFIISEKPVKARGLPLKEEPDKSFNNKYLQDLQTFFASEPAFIPVTISAAEAQKLTQADLKKFIAAKMSLESVQAPEESAFSATKFISGNFAIDENYNEDFLATIDKNGRMKVFPNFTLYAPFVLNEDLYFWGVWNYPETGWCEMQIYKFSESGLKQVFTEDSFSS
jgi:hypothetical protein